MNNAETPRVFGSVYSKTRANQILRACCSDLREASTHREFINAVVFAREQIYWFGRFGHFWHKARLKNQLNRAFKLRKDRSEAIRRRIDGNSQKSQDPKGLDTPQSDSLNDDPFYVALRRYLEAKRALEQDPKGPDSSKRERGGIH